MRAPMVLLLFSGIPSVSDAQDTLDYEVPPISYAATKPSNPVQDLKEACDQGKVILRASSSRELLIDLLDKLAIPASTQVLSFAKHSLQSHHISPANPRSIYFNDGVYLGHVQDEEGLFELATFDARLGCTFYVVKKPVEKGGKISIERETNRCMTCHGGNRSRGVPGVMVRSVFVAPDGQPVLSAGSFRSDHTSPLKNRWGGWYVTGKSGGREHLGNYILPGKKKPSGVNNQQGINRDGLPQGIADQVLVPTSDIAALMVLEHETDAVNYITRLMYQYQLAGKPGLDGKVSPALEGAIQDLVGQLLFAGEFKLESPVQGSGQFRADFERQGPRSPDGRSLREMDMRTRMFRHPLSYMVYSRAFQALPEELRTKVWSGIYQIVNNPMFSPGFEGLTSKDKEAIREIVTQTIKPLPDFWK